MARLCRFTLSVFILEWAGRVAALRASRRGYAVRRHAGNMYPNGMDPSLSLWHGGSHVGHH